MPGGYNPYDIAFNSVKKTVWGNNDFTIKTPRKFRKGTTRFWVIF